MAPQILYTIHYQITQFYNNHIAPTKYYIKVSINLRYFVIQL